MSWVDCRDRLTNNAMRIFDQDFGVLLIHKQFLLLLGSLDQRELNIAEHIELLN